MERLIKIKSLQKRGSIADRLRTWAWHFTAWISNPGCVDN